MKKITKRSKGYVRPRAIPRNIWSKIKVISNELCLTIPDTLNLLTLLYADVRQGRLIEKEKCGR